MQKASQDIPSSTDIAAQDVNSEDLSETYDTYQVVEEAWGDTDLNVLCSDCGDYHQVTAELITEIIDELLLDDEPEEITHRQVIQVAMDIWEYGGVCKFFIDAIANSAQQIAGKTMEKYPLAQGITIIKDFSNNWEGCPDAEKFECTENWTIEEIGNGAHEKNVESH